MTFSYLRDILQIDLILKQVKSYHTPRKKEREKGGDLIETRQEADQKAEDQARTSGARPGKLAGRQTEAERRAYCSPQEHEHNPRHPAAGRMTSTGRSSSMNRYKITYIVDEGETETAYITERTEAAARKVFKAASKGREITDVELDDTDVPATKEQERETLSKIKQMVEELGPQSYIAAAFEGCFDVAEQNIEDDFACSMKQRAETAEQQLAYNRRELDDAKKRLKELGGLVDSLKEENRSLGLRLTRSVFPSDLYLDLWTLATDDAKESRERMASAADIMAEMADTTQDIAFTRAVTIYREQKARAARCERMVAGLDEHRPEGV